jgi:type IV pilus assembly protein PilC
VALFILGLLVLKIVPTFGEMLKDFGGALPWLTRFCIDVSAVVRANFSSLAVLVVVSLVVIAVVVRSALYTSSLGYSVDWFKLHLGVIGRVYLAGSMARFSRALGLLLASEAPAVESLDLSAAASGNAVIRRAAVEAAGLVNGGERLSDALESTGRFEHSFCWLLANSEERGDLDTALLSLADGYDRLLSRWSRILFTLLGPALIFLLALVVGVVIVALYLPILTLANTISGAF